MKILLAIKGFPDSTPTVRYAGLIASSRNSNVTLLTVLGADETEAEGEVRLRSIAALLPRTAVINKITRGPIVDAIVKEAAAGYDLVIVGWRDATGLLDLLLDERVPQRIADKAPVPVLVVKEERPELRRIMVATGGQKLSRALFRHAAHLARHTEAQLTVLHVVTPVPAMYAGMHALEEPLERLMAADTPIGRHLRWGRQYLAEQGVEADWLLERGPAADVILLKAVDLDVDLIVIGARMQANVLRRLLVDDVPSRVVDWAERPVLVVRDSD